MFHDKYDLKNSEKTLEKIKDDEIHYYCNIASPILLEEGDVDIISDNLSQDLLIHNSVYEKLCLD